MRKLTAILLIFWGSSLFAQDIINKTGVGGKLLVKDQNNNNFFTVDPVTGHSGVGLNVVNPRASLEVGGTDGLLVTGTANVGTVLALGAGVRLHWYPRKGAFRVGMAETSWWDDNGSSTPNMALYSIGMGYQVRPTGVASSAIGAYNKATGDYSLSLGSYSSASGSHAIAIGTQVYASGIYSVAIGAGANTNGKDGSFVFGDDTYFQTAYSSADNQLTMRFNGGYRLWSSYPDSTAGVYMRHGQSGWSGYCDRNIKENFEILDGELLLSKISRMPITKWNYKKTDPNFKYIGPMAQDFYAAFHLGGTDSLGINSISIDGVNMAGVQALEKRTTEMKNEIAKLAVENKKLINEIADVKKYNETLIAENKKFYEKYTDVKEYQDGIAEIQKLKSELEYLIKIAKSKQDENKVIVAGKE